MSDARKLEIMRACLAHIAEVDWLTNIKGEKPQKLAHDALTAVEKIDDNPDQRERAS